MNGTQVRIEAHGYVAEVSAVGGGLRTLAHRGRDLVVGFAAAEPRPMHRGVLAAPWPNRIGDGRYRFGGATHQLPIDEPARRTALHGLAMWADWEVTRRTTDGVVLGHRLPGRTGYPFPLDLEVTHAVDRHGLSVTLRATNVGTEPAPYGCTFHPYLRAGDEALDDWTLEVPARAYLEADDRGLPTSRRAVEGTPLDFRVPRRIGPTAIDHAFTELEDRCVRVRDGRGSGVQMGWDAASDWLQIYTSDQGGGPHHRAGLAVEPMTCPPDAFRSGTDVVVLDPGASHEARWTITAVAG